MIDYALEQIDNTSDNPLDLVAEARQLDAAGTAYEWYRIQPVNAQGYRDGEAATMLYVPDAGRAGIAWGADADWTDARSAEEAARRWATGEMIE